MARRASSVSASSRVALRSRAGFEHEHFGTGQCCRHSIRHVHLLRSRVIVIDDSGQWPVTREQIFEVGHR